MRLAKWLAAICATSIIAAYAEANNPSPVGKAPEAGSPPIGKGELNANTHIVTESDAAGSSLTDDTFTVIKPQATVYKIGDVLIIDAHGGRLVRVVGVRETGTEIHYQYEQASLAEAFKSLDIHMQGP